jgi:hypothetical protein
MAATTLGGAVYHALGGHIMRTRIAGTAVAALLAAPLAASGHPTRFQLETTLQPGERAALTIGKVPRGEFRFAIRAFSDGEKRFGLVQGRGTTPRFAVLNVPSPFADTACQDSAGSVLCTGISTPAPVAGATYTFRLKNKGDRPLEVNFVILWRRVASAG